MTDSRTPSDLVNEAIADLQQALEDLEQDRVCPTCRDDPRVWDAAGDLVQGAAGLLSDAARQRREGVTV